MPRKKKNTDVDLTFTTIISGLFAGANEESSVILSTMGPDFMPEEEQMTDLSIYAGSNLDVNGKYGDYVPQYALTLIPKYSQKALANSDEQKQKIAEDMDFLEQKMNAVTGNKEMQALPGIIAHVEVMQDLLKAAREGKDKFSYITRLPGETLIEGSPDFNFDKALDAPKTPKGKAKLMNDIIIDMQYDKIWKEMSARADLMMELDGAILNDKQKAEAKQKLIASNNKLIAAYQSQISPDNEEKYARFFQNYQDTVKGDRGVKPLIAKLEELNQALENGWDPTRIDDYLAMKHMTELCKTSQIALDEKKDKVLSDYSEKNQAFYNLSPAGRHFASQEEFDKYFCDYNKALKDLVEVASDPNVKNALSTLDKEICDERDAYQKYNSKRNRAIEQKEKGEEVEIPPEKPMPVLASPKLFACGISQHKMPVTSSGFMKWDYACDVFDPAKIVYKGDPEAVAEKQRQIWLLSSGLMPAAQEFAGKLAEFEQKQDFAGMANYLTERLKEATPEEQEQLIDGYDYYLNSLIEPDAESGKYRIIPEKAETFEKIGDALSEYFAETCIEAKKAMLQMEQDILDRKIPGTEMIADNPKLTKKVAKALTYANTDAGKKSYASYDAWSRPLNYFELKRPLNYSKPGEGSKELSADFSQRVDGILYDKMRKNFPEIPAEQLRDRDSLEFIGDLAYPKLVEGGFTAEMDAIKEKKPLFSKVPNHLKEIMKADTPEKLKELKLQLFRANEENQLIADTGRAAVIEAKKMLRMLEETGVTGSETFRQLHKALTNMTKFGTPEFETSPGDEQSRSAAPSKRNLTLALKNVKEAAENYEKAHTGIKKIFNNNFGDGAKRLKVSRLAQQFEKTFTEELNKYQKYNVKGIQDRKEALRIIDFEEKRRGYEPVKARDNEHLRGKQYNLIAKQIDRMRNADDAGRNDPEMKRVAQALTQVSRAYNNYVKIRSEDGSPEQQVQAIQEITDKIENVSTIIGETSVFQENAPTDTYSQYKKDMLTETSRMLHDFGKTMRNIQFEKQIEQDREFVQREQALDQRVSQYREISASEEHTPIERCSAKAAADSILQLAAMHNGAADQVPFTPEEMAQIRFNIAAVMLHDATQSPKGKEWTEKIPSESKVYQQSVYDIANSEAFKQMIPEPMDRKYLKDFMTDKNISKQMCLKFMETRQLQKNTPAHQAKPQNLQQKDRELKQTF